MKKLKKALALISMVGVSAVVHAQTAPTGPDLSGLTDNISFGSVITAVMAVASGLALLYAAIKGATVVLSMIRGR